MECTDMTQPETSEFGKSCRNSIIFCSLMLIVAIIVAAVLPAKDNVSSIPVVSASTETENEIAADFGVMIEEAGFTATRVVSGDEGLALYRQPSSRGAV